MEVLQLRRQPDKQGRGEEAASQAVVTNGTRGGPAKAVNNTSIHGAEQGWNNHTVRLRGGVHEEESRSRERAGSVRPDR